MNARETVFWIYLIALVIGIVLMFLVLQAIPKVVWEFLQYIPVYMKIEIAGAIGFVILLCICGVLIAYWVARDAEDLENHQVQFRRISYGLDEIEKRHREEDKKKD